MRPNLTVTICLIKTINLSSGSEKEADLKLGKISCSLPDQRIVGKQVGEVADVIFRRKLQFKGGNITV